MQQLTSCSVFKMYTPTAFNHRVTLVWLGTDRSKGCMTYTLHVYDWIPGWTSGSCTKSDEIVT